MGVVVILFRMQIILCLLTNARCPAGRGQVFINLKNFRICFWILSRIIILAKREGLTCVNGNESVNEHLGKLWVLTDWPLAMGAVPVLGTCCPPPESTPLLWAPWTSSSPLVPVAPLGPHRGLFSSPPHARSRPQISLFLSYPKSWWIFNRNTPVKTSLTSNTSMFTLFYITNRTTPCTTFVKWILLSLNLSVPMPEFEP